MRNRSEATDKHEKYTQEKNMYSQLKNIIIRVENNFQSPNGNMFHSYSKSNDNRIRNDILIHLLINHS